LRRFQQLSDQTGAEYADPNCLSQRLVLWLIPRLWLKQFDAKKLKVDEAYQAARDAGETKQVVDVTKLDRMVRDKQRLLKLFLFLQSTLLEQS
jgi:hypothetical protein